MRPYNICKNCRYCNTIGKAEGLEGGDEVDGVGEVEENHEGAFGACDGTVAEEAAYDQLKISQCEAY